MKGKLLIGALSSLLCVSCAFNGIPNVLVSRYDKSIINNTEKTFIGIPALFSIEGSTARLNHEWLVSAAHNSAIISTIYNDDDVYFHPKCDIVLIRTHGDNTVDVGILYENSSVIHVGYPMALPISANAGTYYTDVINISDGKYQNCQYSISDAVVASGMSGGGVYNDSNELVGINNGILSDTQTDDVKLAKVIGKDVAFFTTLYYTRHWIQQITGIDFFGGN